MTNDVVLGRMQKAADAVILAAAIRLGVAVEDVHLSRDLTDDEYGVVVEYICASQD
jgi:hypothetical protein